MTVRKLSLTVCATALVIAGCGDDSGSAKTSDLAPDQWAAELCGLADGLDPDSSTEPTPTDVTDFKAYFVDTYRRLAEQFDTLADQVEDLGDPPIDGGSGFASDFARHVREVADSIEADADKIDAIDATDPVTFSEELDKLGPDESMSNVEDPIEADYPEVKKLIDETQPGCLSDESEQ